MKYLFILILAICFFSGARGQMKFNDSISSSRIQITRHAMTVLGAWSVLNISTGFIIANQTSGEAKYFWRMNAYWNFINLGLAGLGYLGTQRMRLHSYSFSENMKEQHKIEKLYVFNMGLDLAYIAGGFYLRERGNSEPVPDKKDQFSGYGSSIAVQGGFLLLMDVIVYSLHHRQTRRMEHKLEKLELAAGPGWLGLSYRF